MLRRFVRLGFGLRVRGSVRRLRAPPVPRGGWAGAGVRHAEVSIGAGKYDGRQPVENRWLVPEDKSHKTVHRVKRTIL